MKIKSIGTATWKKLVYAFFVAGLLAFGGAQAQVNVWNAATHFQYNIEKVGVTALPTTPASYSVKVVFSVTDPTSSGSPAWNIKADLPFQSAGAQLTIDIGWDPSTDFKNTGSNHGTLTPLTALGDAPASPVRITGLTNPASAAATPCTPAECGTTGLNRYFSVATVTPLPFGPNVTIGRVGVEGHPVCNGITGFTCPPAATPPAAPYLNVPVRSATADFRITPLTGPLAALLANNARRPIVDINKCKGCHDDQNHGTGVVPRLSLHGGNRNENLNLCVICHNPNQTDVPYRRATTATEDPAISGPEVPVDFKVLIHSIHAGGFRTQPLVVIGRNSSVNDFSDVRFPRQLRDCSNCHIDVVGRGTFELPLGANVLGTTIHTQSTYLTAPRSIDVNPANDVKVSPTAAVCSACHDRQEVRQHMVNTGGASFATTQSAIGTTVIERCVNCHGPGRREDVRRVHEVGGGGGRGDD